MLRSLSLSLSALAVALSSVNVPVNAKPLSSFLLDLNLPENQASFSPLLSQAPETIPEVIVDTIPIDSPSSSSSGEDIVVESPSTPTSTSSDRRFTCESNQGQYTVMYNPQSQPNESYPWAIPQQMGGNWSAERRCREISQRLENYRPDGLLELQTGVMNNENVVCVTSQDDPSCRIVFTVPRGQDPIATRDRVFDNLADANQGRATQGVTTFTSNLNLRDLLNGNRNQTDESINLRPFLDQADGGTGEAL
ncbi:MAG: COP23 domain-containing protein, partial [Halothece sp. Uz-M2-17]|nr:COP23 domain-containing protein [Halothece sp. Uz-M2-17]